MICGDNTSESPQRQIIAAYHAVIKAPNYRNRPLGRTTLPNRVFQKYKQNLTKSVGFRVRSPTTFHISHELLGDRCSTRLKPRRDGSQIVFRHEVQVGIQVPNPPGHRQANRTGDRRGNRVCRRTTFCSLCCLLFNSFLVFSHPKIFSKSLNPTTPTTYNPIRRVAKNSC